MEDAWLALRTLVDANPFLILRESQKDIFEGSQRYITFYLASFRQWVLSI